MPAVKPQCAYYEMYGWQGMRTLAQTIQYAKEKGMYVIEDGKRNDIGTTMELTPQPIWEKPRWRKPPAQPSAPTP